MTQIIENDGETIKPIPLLKVGDGVSQVTMKVYQDVYHQVTGWTEQISRRYKEHLLLGLADLQQLNYKISQLCDIHDIVASNEVVTIFYEKERKEQFTSFERFKLYNANATSPSISVVLKYNFSILLSGRPKPQEYVVTIRLNSRIALMKQMDENDGPQFMRSYVLNNISTADISVDYTDYVVARGFIEAFDEWIKGTKKSRRNALLTFLAPRSHYIPNVLSVIGAFLLTFFALQAIPSLSSDGFYVQTWARFLVIYGGGAYICISLLALAGSLLEQSIDNYPTLSYLNLNNGNNHLIEDFNSQRTPIFQKFIGGCLLAIILGITASKLERLIWSMLLWPSIATNKPGQIPIENFFPVRKKWPHWGANRGSNLREFSRLENSGCMPENIQWRVLPPLK
jgi:hypothetical protein